MKKLKLPTATLFYLNVPVIVEYKGNVCTVEITGATQDFVFTHEGATESFAERLAYYIELLGDYEEALRSVSSKADDKEENPF